MTGVPGTLTPRDLRLLLPALAGWSSAGLGIWLRPHWLWIIGFALVVCVGVFLARGKPQHPVAHVVVVAAVAGSMLFSVWLGGEHRDQPTISNAEGSDVTVTASLRETFTPGARSLMVTLRSVNGHALRGGGIPAVLVGADMRERLPYGATLMAEGYLQRAPTYESGSWVVLVRGSPEWVAQPGWFLRSTDELRRGLLIRSVGLENDGGDLLPGLAIGDTSAVDRGLLQAMRDTSLSHLVAVSGANCAVVVGIVVGIIALFRGGVWARLVGGTLALAGFVVLVTPEPSITRASIMATIVLLFLALGRPLKGIPVLATTVLVILCVNPWMALDFAFALSVLASGGILLLVGPLTELFSRIMPSWLAVMVAVPLAAQIACQPVLILLNPVVPVWAVVANVLAAPAAPLATILGMLVCISGPLLPLLADILVQAAWWPSAFVAFLGRFFSSMPLVTLPWTPGFAGLLAMAGVTYGGVTYLLWHSQRHRVGRRLAGAVALFALLSSLVGHSLPQALVSLTIPKDWAVAQCDVGQGDALVVRTGGHTVLIDTGKYPQKLESCLTTLRVTRLDLVIITHFDVDHVGAWSVIADRVDQVWVGPVVEADHRDIVTALERAGATVVEVRAGDQITLDDYVIRVVWPVTEALSDPGNDSSVVVVVEGLPTCTSCVSGLFLGDLGEKPQRIMMGRQKLQRVDIVKVSHHGSGDQYAGLYQNISARVGLIGVGAENSYGHPATKILDILDATGTRALRSDERGIVTLGKDDHGSLTLWSER